MSWVAAAVITGGAALIGANMQANAAGHAADMQKAAADQALAAQQSTFNTQNAQQAPYRAAGYSALNRINSMLGGQYQAYDENGNPIGAVPNKVFQYTPQNTGNQLADFIANTTGQALVQDSLNQPAPSGTLSNAESDYLTHRYNAQDFAQGIDPGYAWRLQQGQMANQRAANIGGGALSGNTLAGLQAYTQGQASQEYGNAFNRFQTERGNIYNTLASIAGLGQTANQQSNQLAQNYATNAANLMTGSAAAQGAASVGAANAQAGAIQNAGNMYMLSQMMPNRTPAAAPSGYGTPAPQLDVTLA